MSAPVRVQLSRKKGWRKPENTVVVARPSKWGNPFAARIPHGEALQGAETRALLVRQYRAWIDGMHPRDVVESLPMFYPDGRRFISEPLLTQRPTAREIRAALAGKNIACWCPLDQPCHADVLLELANQEGQDA